MTRYTNIKTGKIIREFDQLITIDPEQVVKLTVGEGFEPSDISTFEKLWKILESENFIWSDLSKSNLENADI